MYTPLKSRITDHHTTKHLKMSNPNSSNPNPPPYNPNNPNNSNNNNNRRLPSAWQPTAPTSSLQTATGGQSYYPPPQAYVPQGYVHPHQQQGYNPHAQPRNPYYAQHQYYQPQPPHTPLQHTQAQQTPAYQPPARERRALVITVRFFDTNWGRLGNLKDTTHPSFDWTLQSAALCRCRLEFSYFMFSHTIVYVYHTHDSLTQLPSNSLSRLLSLSRDNSKRTKMVTPLIWALKSQAPPQLELLRLQLLPLLRIRPQQRRNHQRSRANRQVSN
jgi:hypothetical protein